MKLNRILAQLTAFTLLAASTAHGALVVVTTDIAPSTTTTWYATNEYRLDTIIYVQTNAVLVIEPGTVIKGGTNAANLTFRPGIPNLVSGLWVTRGGKLFATGTISAPIIFTMEGDNVNDPNDIPPTTTGKWGGVVIMGRATINSAFYIPGNGATPVFDVYEGVETAPAPQAEHMFGGNDDADSSGAFRYVSIRHTGSQFAADKELNSLTMGGVGSGTIIEYVESYASSDDAFEWWGGTVNTHHLVAAFCEDDDFDTDQGYRGTNQFWFGIKPPWNGSVDSRGFESDGDTSQTVLGDRVPFSQWTVHNATLIGRGDTNVNFGGGSGWNARDEAAPDVYNTVFTAFNKGILLDTDGLYHWTNSPARADARNNVWDVITASANANGNFLFSEVNRTNTVEAALLGGVSYTNNGALNPRPQPGSPAFDDVLAGAPTPVSYRGAFAASDNWADGWTLLSTAGYLAPANPVKPTVVVATDIAASTTTTWYATNEYRLDTIVYVQTNAVLVIEPGTVIKGGTNAANLTFRPGIPNLVSGLWVTRGGKLFATGTVSAPIVFTMEGDNVNDPNDIPPTTTGKWGGVVIMGRATINSAFYIPGNGASPVFDVYEGVETAPAPQTEHMFGGNDDQDSSGALRYVSIRHTGSQFAADKELNSLTMGGVGSGTIIEYVESYASSDDAFEWWGGTVNTHHLVAAFCEDDDFDTDQGYRGTNQFWFGIKPPWNGSVDSRGFESDGDTSQTVLGDRLPFSQWTVHNATLIGRGDTNVNFGGGSGWNARDEAAPDVYNTVFTEFNKGILLDTDGLYHWTNSPARADARNNVWDVITASANANGNFLFSEANRTNTVEEALLGGVSYTNNGVLNPRPQAGSPAFDDVLAGAATPVNYRGAFAPNDNWADGWTLLSTAGYLAPGVALPNPPVLAIIQNAAMLQITYPSQTGFSYQLQSATNLTSPIIWANEGGAQAGTGGTLTNTVPVSETQKFFRAQAN